VKPSPEFTIMIDTETRPLTRLRAIGYQPMLARAATALSAALQTPTEPMRVFSVHRDTLALHDGREDLTARLAPRLARALQASADEVAVGDWVLAGRDGAAGGLVVHARIEPFSHLARRDGDGRRHALVSNVDSALLLMGLDDDFNPRRLERFLALVQGSGVLPVIVLTKADIAARTAARLERCQGLLRARLPPGLQIVSVDARDSAAGEALQPHLGAGQTLVLLGSSGAGKSTLSNTLLGAALQDTGAVRDSDGRGQHTTTARTLLRLPGGACIIDTPGVRTLSPMGDETALAASFSDIERLRATCRFRNCRHADEPGCAVREGVDGDRLRNYQKLLREMKRDTLTPLQRREQLAQWKARGKAGNARLKAKRGESGHEGF
jgi:ribosome biogenesis GTPase / thiamine phosphate phosphatase